VTGGEEARPGKRNDLQKAVDTMRNTKSLKQVAEQHATSWVHYHRGFESLFNMLFADSRDRSKGTDVVVLWGLTGTGKTKRAYELATKILGEQGLSFYVKAAYNMWWQDYHGEWVVIIDEYCGQWPIAYLLTVLDRYPMNIEYKGGSTQLQARMFIITSNTPPQEWYLTAPQEQKDALLRRCNRNIQVTSLEQEIDIESIECIQ